MPKKGLGRGLGNLFGDEPQGASVGAAAPQPSPERSAKEVGTLLRIADVMPNPSQPRKTFDKESLDVLADSIRRHGVLQPITVRRHTDGRYIIVAGERRWRASRLAGLDEIPALVVDADDRVASELALIENLQREDLNPIEEAEGYKSLIDEFGLTQEEVADAVGRGRATVTNSLRLLSLDPEVVGMIREGRLSAGHAKPLASLSHEAQRKLAAEAAANGLSVREMEQAARRAKSKPTPASSKSKRSAGSKQAERYIEQLCDTLSKRYERKVRITGAGRQGKVEFEYYDMDDLNHILEIFLGMTGGDEK